MSNVFFCCGLKYTESYNHKQKYKIVHGNISYRKSSGKKAIREVGWVSTVASVCVLEGQVMLTNDVGHAHYSMKLPLSKHNTSMFCFTSQALLNSSFSLNFMRSLKVEVVKLYGLKAKCSQLYLYGLWTVFHRLYWLKKKN